MKRWILILLCGAILLGLFGCKQPLEPNVTKLPEQESTGQTEVSSTEGTEEVTRPAPTTQPTVPSEPPETVEGDFLVAVTLNPGSNNIQDPEGNEIFSFQYQDLSVLIPEYPEAAQAIEDELNAGIQSTWETAQSLQAWAQEEYARSQPDDWTPYYVRILYRPERFDTRVFSISGAVDDFAGGAHPNVTAISATFDTVTGKALSLAEILVDESSLINLQTLVLGELVNMSDTVELFDYEEAVANRFDPTNPASSYWYFSHDGLVFYFSPYEIAAYGSGTITVKIPYENLAGILKEEYFPAELSKAKDYTIGAAKMSEINADDFALKFDITIDNGGEEVAIFTDTELYQIQLASGYWNIFDDQFNVNQILFAANRITSQDLLRIQTYIPDTLPNLRLTTRTSTSDTETLYISQSGKDGSILLLNGEDI